MQFISYAQNYEDVMLYRALKQINNGFYIDVGAQDPTAHSVTKAFYDKGWHGINIEPVSQWFEKLKQERPADLNLQIAAGENEGRIRFFEFPDMGLSTADPLFAEKYKESGFRVHETEVSVRRLDTICQEHSVKNIHFLKIDVEGMESAVLKGFNLKQWRPWIILIEATEPNTTIQNYKKWENILTSQEYEFVYFDGLNRFYLAKEHIKALSGAFQTPPNCLDNFVDYQKEKLLADVIYLNKICAEERLHAETAEQKLQTLTQNNQTHTLALQQHFDSQKKMLSFFENELLSKREILITTQSELAKARKTSDQLQQKSLFFQETMIETQDLLKNERSLTSSLKKNILDLTKLLNQAQKELNAEKVKMQQYQAISINLEAKLLGREKELAYTTAEYKKIKNALSLQENEVVSLRQTHENTLSEMLKIKQLFLQLQQNLWFRVKFSFFPRNKSFTSVSAQQKGLNKIVIDLTPVLPGGTNGGAKIVVLELLQKLINLLPKTHFVLLTTPANHEELSVFDQKNIVRLCTSLFHDTPWPFLSYRLKQWLSIHAIWILKILRFAKKIGQHFGIRKATIKKYLPINLIQKNKSTAQPKFDDSVSNADLFFCPFGATNLLYLLKNEKKIPIVSIVYDLQYKTYPQFFSKEDCRWRDEVIRNAAKDSTRLICISDYTKKSLSAYLPDSQNKSSVIHINLQHRLPTVSQRQCKTTLFSLKLWEEDFLLFPANFWAHKNHHVLLVSFSMYVNQYQSSTLKLVCSGAESTEKMKFITMIAEMGLSHRIIVTEYLSASDFAVLVNACKAIIFPSLYEGFGMPVLEAMAHKKPILCSNTTSLPEVAGDAAIFFDPRKPREIVNAIHLLEKMSQDEIDQLISKGSKNLARFENNETMAKKYIAEFEKAINA